MLLQARLDFVIYSIGIDLASLVVKIKVKTKFGCWEWSAPKDHPQPHRLTQINILHSEF
jgi:hypothetical protein